MGALVVLMKKDLGSYLDASPFSLCYLFHTDVLEENGFPFSSQIYIKCNHV